MAKNARKTKTGRDTSIVNGALYFEDARQCLIDDANMAAICGDGYTNSIRVHSLESGWEQKVYHNGQYIGNEEINFEMTLRREIRYQRGHWYAYRRVHGNLYKRYVGTDDALTQARLLTIALKMPSK